MVNNRLCNGSITHCVTQSTRANTLTFPAGSGFKPSPPSVLHLLVNSLGQLEILTPVSMKRMKDIFPVDFK
jgi:hypothetical protein